MRRIARTAAAIGRAASGTGLSCALSFAIAVGLAAGCAGSGATARPPARDAAKPDLFPELSSSLERQLAERRRDALARGAEIKALEIDPFEGEATHARLQELHIPSLGGCTTEKGRLHRDPALRAYRQLHGQDFRSSEPRSLDPRLTRETLARRPVVPFVFISCTLEIETQGLPTGGFEVRARSARFAAFFDAELSWIEPHQQDDPTSLQHAQLHFDLADLLAREANRLPWTPEVIGRGSTRDTATDDFGLRWAAQLGKLQAELARFESQLDRETAQGWDQDAQTHWARRIGEGLPAIRAALPER
ncbi:MAG: hypothetical protein GY723_00170 [bacterium]|nr:hypothetical protein [bacterium]MCP5065841.1 hypothetical protein [bacterium]